MEKNILNTAVIAGMGLLLAGSAFAAKPNGASRDDIYGDSLISLPMDESTVITDTATVWFVEIDEAEAYTVDIVGAGKNGNIRKACDNSISPNPDRAHDSQMILMPSDISCGMETTNTMKGDSTGDKVAPPLALCSWTTPILADGQYAMAINPVDIGGSGPNTRQETRRGASSCAPGADDAFGGLPYMKNKKRQMSNATDGSYQLFDIANANPAATLAPMKPEPLTPLAGASYGNKFTFQDESGYAGAATWYELFIWDKNNVRISSYGSNTTYPNWYKVGVDLQLTCNVTLATGNRQCTFKNGGPAAKFNTPGFLGEIASYGPNDVFTWYVRSWNMHGYSGWSDSGSFVK